MHPEESRQDKRQIYRSSLLAVLGGLLIIALICVAFVLPTIRHNLECSHFPSGGTWVCDDLNLSINFDDYTAVFQSGQQTVTCEMIREFNSNYIVLENGVIYGALFSGECVDLSDTVLKIEESKTERIYLFRKAESH